MADGDPTRKDEDRSTKVSGADNRRADRMSLPAEAPLFRLDEGFTVLDNCDISEGGVSFLSEHKFAEGARLRLDIKNMLNMEIEIVHCEMTMVDTMFLEAKYRIGAKFSDGKLDPELFKFLTKDVTE